MRKMRCFLIILVIIIFLIVNATATAELPPDELFYESIAQLNDYISSGGTRFDISGICDNFEKTYRYGPNGMAFWAYAMIIRDVDAGNWDSVYDNIDILKRDASFQEYVESDDFTSQYKQIRKIDELEGYCQGRKAQEEGRLLDAVSSYSSCLNFYDSYQRRQESQNTFNQQQEQQYNRACELYEHGQKEEAAAIFKALGSFSDSSTRYDVIEAELAGERQAAEYEAKYRSACELLENGSLQEAATAFEELGDYNDSKELYLYVMQLIEDQEKEKRGKVSPFIVNTYNRHTYAAFEEAEYTWEKAEEYCKQNGGHLVTITSSEEQDHIEKMIEKGSKGLYWIGGKRDAGGSFRWIDDNSLVNDGYKNWDEGQPDNNDGKRREDYMQILRVPNPDGSKMADGTPWSKKNRWNNNVNDNDYGSDFFSIHNVGFICEWDDIIERDDIVNGVSQAVVKDGDYKIAVYDDERYYLDIRGYDIPAKAGANVQLWYSKDGVIDLSDTWSIRYDQHDGYYRISQYGQELSLDVSKGSKKDGGNVQVWTNNTASAQKWAIKQNADGSYRIIAKCSGLSLDIDACKIEKNTNVQQWSANDSIAQKWLLIPYDGNTYYVASDEIKEWVYLRSKPSKEESTIIMKVPKWHTVTYTGEMTGDYMGVKYRDKTGYIYSKYLRHFDHP